KIIGARYYLKGYEAYYGSLNRTYAYRSPRDHDGHGTHTASTVAGRVVPGVSALGGFARGTAAGGAPLARLAIYKVCWPIPGPNPNIENTCFDADMLAAFDDAIGDGVHVLSVSIGASGVPPKYSNDGIAIGALHAAKHGIVVACSAGNDGPAPATVSNLAPWMITVGASSIDRAFDSLVLLGNGVTIKAVPAQFSGCQEGEREDSGLPEREWAQSGQRIGGKAGGWRGYHTGECGGQWQRDPCGRPRPPGDRCVVRRRNSHPKVHQRSPQAERKDRLGSDCFGSHAGAGHGRLLVPRSEPRRTQYSQGLNILAAWSESSSPTKLEDDHRSVKYNLYSGTSMSCPHVSAVAALLKSLHPDWSSSAIRSAMMTTGTPSCVRGFEHSFCPSSHSGHWLSFFSAAVVNTRGAPLTDAAGQAAGPLELGSGHVRPNHASDPGLVYDASYEDYLLFACSSIGAQMDPSFPCPETSPSPSDLNYPSIAISDLNGSVTVRRTVTNVGPGATRYRVTVTEPTGVSVSISPGVLSFKRVGQKKSFSVTLKARGTPGKVYVAGSYTWSDGAHVVRSPIVVSVA
ncbi:hypothetical protein B296_00036801, partial [Ensete ventricosum]